MEPSPGGTGGADQPDPLAGLLRRWQEEGDADALDGLLRLEMTALKARLRHRGQDLVGASASVSDIAQGAVVKLLDVESPPRFDHPRELRAWLWTVAWRMLIDRSRRPGRRMLRIDEEGSRAGSQALLADGSIDGVERREQSLALNLALNLLREPEQEVLRLVYLEQLGIEGAAERMGIKHEAAKMRVVRARRSLAAKLVSWTDVIG